ncbi:Dystrophin [Acipenser ruthenus]|uniref:Dystrophin n=1 Tax=Acipenser ruthenus TaxID=7906 RepID=A0A444U967_ACIRT|nr:Dystrophin [Acipenser ruthenus]
MSRTPRCSLVSSSFVKHLELQDGIGSQQAVVTALNVTGEEIIQQTFADDAGIFKGKLASVNARWQEVCRLVAERRRRLEEEENILSELQEDLNEFICWLEEAESIAAIQPEPGNELQLKECLEKVKLRVEELPPRERILKQLNESGELALERKLNREEHKKIEIDLKQANHHWAQVSRDLPEKQKEIEYLLRGVTQFQQQLHQLALWASTTKDQLELYRQVGIPGAFDTKETEDEAQAKQADVEAILSKAQQLYKEKPITQPIKGKLEDLSSDWKAINTLLLQLKGKPEASRVISTGVCQTVTVLSQTLVTKETTTSKLEMPSSLLMEVPAMADFNKAWVELTDWLSLLHHVIKTQIVTVGDLEEINDMIVKQKATLQDLEQRHPQLEDLITVAQNLKNKTNNPEARATITDRSKYHCRTTMEN